LEVARGLGTLYRDHGWRPLRSIYLLSWSGEEYGLLGSTGWAELNQDTIQRALVYINVDTVVSGDRLKAAASPSLTTIWKRVLKDIMGSPSNNEHAVEFGNGPFGSLVDGNTNWKWRRSLEEEEDDDEAAIGAPEIGVLGSGSDYTVFLDHFGIPSLDFSFGKKAAYGQYHSIYDSFAWMDRFGGRDGQPGSSFELMAFAAKIWGLLAMRLATSPLVPLDHMAQGVALSQYVTAIEQQQQQQQSVKLDLEPLKVAIQSYREAAASLQLHCFKKEEDKDESGLDDGSIIKEEEVEDLVSSCNEKLGLTERHFLDVNGLPGRPWFRHVLQAPGMDLGYAAEAFPGIQQAIDDGNWTLAQEQVTVASERVKSAAGHLKP
jgi:hypothetical protein